MILISIENELFERRYDPVMNICWGVAAWGIMAAFVWSVGLGLN